MTSSPSLPGVIRRATPDAATYLNALARRSALSWGHEPEVLDCRAVLPGDGSGMAARGTHFATGLSFADVPVPPADGQVDPITTSLTLEKFRRTFGPVAVGYRCSSAKWGEGRMVVTDQRAGLMQDLIGDALGAAQVAR